MRLLHAGCGYEPLPPWVGAPTELVRLDINPAVRPDICADLCNMGEIGSFDAIYCGHTLEHLFLHDISKALREFLRVLKPGGRALIRVPDLEGIKPTGEVIYTSEGGDPIAGVDMFFGHRKSVVTNPFMAHRFGFVQDTLDRVLKAAGFARVDVKRVPNMHELWGIAVKKALVREPESEDDSSLQPHASDGVKDGKTKEPLCG